MAPEGTFVSASPTRTVPDPSGPNAGSTAPSAPSRTTRPSSNPLMPARSASSSRPSPDGTTPCASPSGATVSNGSNRACPSTPKSGSGLPSGWKRVTFQPGYVPPPYAKPVSTMSFPTTATCRIRS